VYGLVGADQRCRSLAAQAGLKNFATFKAWLSDKATSPRLDLHRCPAHRPLGRDPRDLALVDHGRHRHQPDYLWGRAAHLLLRTDVTLDPSEAE